MPATLEQIFRGVREYLQKQGGAAKVERDVEAQYMKHNIEHMETMINKQIGYLEVAILIRSASTASKYVTRIRFYKILILDEFSEGTPVRVTDLKSGDIWYVERAVPQTEVGLKCGCYDFLFRWQEPLYKVGSLIGRPKKPPVKGAVTKSGKPWKSQNVEKVLGACKHCLALVEFLSDIGVVGMSERYPREIVLS